MATQSVQEKIITNDLYLAAFLLSKGCELVQAGRNNRKRISFVLSGKEASTLRDVYRSGNVSLNVRSYRDSIQQIRRMMDNIHRSDTKICSPDQYQQPDLQ